MIRKGTEVKFVLQGTITNRIKTKLISKQQAKHDI